MDLSTLQAFHFLRPAWLAALPPLLGLAAWLWRRRRGEGGWARVIDPELLPALQLEGPGGPAAASPWPWLALGWTLAVLALAGPSWQQDISAGYRAPAAWVVVLDLSPSMAAADLQPDRVTRARYAIDDLLGAARDARVGLVAFSDEPYTVSPLTDDVATVRALSQPLTPGIMPSAGDQLAPALRQAGQLLRQAGAREERVIVLTDGFSDPAAALAAAQDLRSRGATVSVVGVGTSNGAPLHEADGGFARDAQGRTLMSRLDADLLQRLASVGGGDYVDLSELPRLTAQMRASAPPGGRAAATQGIHLKKWRDAGAWLLPGLLLVAAALSRRGWL